MDNSFKNQIDSAKSVLILLPSKPYFDQVAAGLSLFLAMGSIKDVQISCPSPMLVEFNRLVGVDKITSELGSKNLIIKFANYDATGIERVSYDIENGEFRLTIIPKSGVNSPNKDQVIFDHSGVAADTILLIGGANETHFPALSLKDFEKVKLIHIGVRELAVSAGKEVISFARASSSISELVASLIKESGWQIDADIATNILMGIEAGTNGYTSNFVSADTFQMIADLLRLGGKRHTDEIKRQQFPQGAIPQPLPIQPQTLSEVKSDVQTQQVEDKENVEPPKDWLNTPKIYKGTSVG